MDLSIREAAALLGRSPRTLRSQVARGEITGTKKGKSWVIAQQNLPLTAAQHQQVQQRADELRQSLESVLPSRRAHLPGDRRPRLGDVPAFQKGAQALAQLNQLPGGARLAPKLRRLLRQVGAAWFLYERQAKLNALDAARQQLGRLVADLLLDLEPNDPALAVISLLEDGVGTALHDLARQVSRLPPRRR